ncbi:D-inositol 3-phosphate glycosyltransferase [Caloramator mitchellensis]|uniref:D-inositol 3-phosphate glycosyltransferase n=1 Tax=Caloramator mitchellensis TaxID=908809 RepID=A0A0R3JW48_CALMK|nr:glycosyltransferase family 1 protein [Caloramator mitchellensis]KRQ87785.1 D-inositol 3-phosphate glycosyltransferase [Caloramator mitchellensis]
MKIGFDARAAIWYRGTGIGTYTYQLIKNISIMDKNNDYLVFLPSENFDIIFDDNFNVKQIDKCEKETFWEQVDVPNILTDTGIEIYHVPQNGIGLPYEKNCKFVITLHDVIPYKMPETVGPQYLKIYLEEIPKILPLCDGIITVSEYSKMDIAKTLNYPEEKIFVTYLAAEDIYFPLNKKYCKEFIRKKYCIDEDFILYVGGFSPRKNIKGLIKAYSLIKNKIGNIKLVILGKKGRSYFDYRDLALSLGLKNDVVFPGFIEVEELPIFYNAAKMLVYPSFYEGFGLPPLEAMACGTPVVASNATSIPEVLKSGALYINPYDEYSIAEKMLMLVEDDALYNEMALKGLFQSSFYCWKRTAVETLSAYNKLSK